MSDLIVHPFAERFPMMTDAELGNLAESIKRNGIRVPIKIRKSDGWLIDGRNRLAACNRIGVTAPTEIVDLDELQTLELIADLNIPRRHLTQSQKAAMAADYAERISKASELLLPGNNNSPGRPSKGITRAVSEAAEKFDVSAQSVNNARKAISADPENANKIASGEVTVKAAAEKARESRKRELKVCDANTKPIDGKPNDPKDKLGQPIPKELWQVFVTQRFGDIKSHFDGIRSVIKLLLNESAGFHVNKHVSATEKYLIPGLDSIRYQLIDDGEPYCVCITCNGTGKVRIDACKSCKGCGWLTKYKWRQIKDDAEAEASIRK
jgi:ParB-like chromosome segregation protein Spo0J